MRVLILLITVLYLGNLWGQEIPQGQLVKSLDWEDIYKKNPTFSTLDGHLKIDYEKNAAGKIELKIESAEIDQPGSRGYDVADFSPADLEKLGTGSYAVLGEMRTDKIAPRSPLAMWSNYPSGTGNLDQLQQWFPALDSTGNTFTPKLTQEWQSFWFPFDTKTARPISLSVNVRLLSPGTIYFRNMRLVQYTETAVANRKLNWESFLIGAAAILLAQLAGGGIVFLSRRWSRRRHGRELRRMASLDS